MDPVAGDPSVTTSDQTFPYGTVSDTYTLTFSEEVFGVDTSNVAWVAITGSGTMDSINTVDGINHDIGFSGAVDGDQYLLIIDTDIEDTCGNTLASTVTIIIQIATCPDPDASPQERA